jgi:hypothetical protein
MASFSTGVVGLKFRVNGLGADGPTSRQEQKRNTGVLRSAQNDHLKTNRATSRAIMALRSDSGDTNRYAIPRCLEVRA